MNRYDILEDMIEFIDNNDITDFYELVFYARHQKTKDWFYLLCDDNTEIIYRYLESKQRIIEDDLESVIQCHLVYGKKLS